MARANPLYTNNKYERKLVLVDPQPISTLFEGEKRHGLHDMVFVRWYDDSSKDGQNVQYLKIYEVERVCRPFYLGEDEFPLYVEWSYKAELVEIK